MTLKVWRSSARRISLICVLCLGLLLGSIAVVGCGTDEPGPEGETASATAVAGRSIQFSVVTEEAGLGDFRHVTGAFGEKWFPETVGGGVGFLDYDSDGWQDLVLVEGASWPESGMASVSALRLYRNAGDGTFVDVTAQVGLAGLRAYGQGLAVADYNNDGHPDIFLTAVGRNRMIGSPAFVT